MKINYFNVDLNGTKGSCFGQGVGCTADACFASMLHRKGMMKREIKGLFLIPIIAMNESCFFCGALIDAVDAEQSYKEAQKIITKSSLKKQATPALICASCNVSPKSSFVLRPLFIEKRGEK